MTTIFFITANIGLFISSIILVTHYDPIKKLLSLIALFLSASFIFISYNFYFLGLTYLIVYIGAIAILFLFVIMMVPLDNWNYSDHQIKWAISNKTLYYSLIFFLASLLTITYKLIDLENLHIYQTFGIDTYDWFNPLTLNLQTDIIILANILFVFWPILIILVSFLLWLILIGILHISMK